MDPYIGPNSGRLTALKPLLLAFGVGKKVVNMSIDQSAVNTG
jgi:hypothetical protein